MHRCLTTSQIQQELSRLCDTQEDVSGDESFDDLSMNLSENVDAEFQPEQVTSSSDDSEADFPDTGNTFTVNLRRGRGVSRRSISGGRTGRGGRSSRTTSGPEVGILQIASDGTEWTCISPNAFEVGRCSQQNILREISGPTPYAKRYIENDKPISAWRLLIDEYILRRIKECTEKEAHDKSQNETWNLSLDELDAFIALIYARGAYNMSHLDLDILWSEDWGPPVFNKTMSKNRYKEIMEYLRFDMRSTRSVRLANDKFAMISDTWKKFIDNC
ncbi:uncharacterized protein LOC129238721 [Anastrepha obliqua]|uniref:uncharacterized protein LOC129238721 n=1 Tax=Anastrepha obliqua TaxID=95512 RepID=UPI002409212B|nr:uncharacterized protein LOC129238721 [Anastrepha obliqua]